MGKVKINKAYCFFEQSGVFKNAFKEYGIPAEDFDIQNNFGETDRVQDLFAEIEKGYAGQPSLFDEITPDDLIMAFFPCIYFCAFNAIIFSGRTDAMVSGCLTTERKYEYLLERSRNRQRFYELALKLVGICEIRGLRLIIENPYHSDSYLHNNFPIKPEFIDFNRRLRGDYFIKPTMFLTLNIQLHKFKSVIKPKEIKKVKTCKSAPKAGICSEEKSLIHPNYARAFVREVILNKGGDKKSPYQMSIDFD